MQCPRCTEMVANECIECPFCRKPLTAQGQASLRMALTGETYETTAETGDPSAPARSKRFSTFPSVINPPEPEPEPPVKLIGARPDLFPEARPAPAPIRIHASRDNLLWLIVAFAVAGVVAGAILWVRPYVDPVQITAMSARMGEVTMLSDTTRPIPAVYLWLWGSYCVLAVATQFLLPAPWRAGPFRMRTNWVLIATTLATLVIFVDTGPGRQGGGLLQGEYLFRQEGGQFLYRDRAGSRSVTVDEARLINARQIQTQEYGIYKVWNMAALLSFLALGAYAAWWIIERPEADSVEQELDLMALVRRARGEPEPCGDIPQSATVPAECTRSREPAPGDVPWR